MTPEEKEKQRQEQLRGELREEFSTPTPRTDKTLLGAYGRAFVGLMLGILGLHRFYLGQRLYGFLLTAPVLAAVFIFVSVYAEFIGQFSGATSAALSGDISQIPDLDKILAENRDKLIISTYLAIGGGGWFVVDMFLLPSALKKYRAGR